MLAVNGNQGNLETDIREYFGDEVLCKEIEKTAGYKKSVEKAHGQIEIREYYQTEKKMSLKWKRFNISFAPAQFIEELMQI